MDEVTTRLAMGAKAWIGFARSFALEFAAVYYAATVTTENNLDPAVLTTIGDAIFIGLLFWFILFVVRIVFPDIFLRYIWYGCSLLVLPLSAWPIKWTVIVVACIISLFRGVLVAPTIIFYGGLLLVDFISQSISGV